MGFQQGLSGLNASARNLDVIGNNIANVSTVGFKSSRSEFADVYAASLYGSSSLSAGIGTKLTAVAQQFNQGNITVTNNPLDIAINGNGFFKVTSSDTGEAYTRNGQFYLDGDGYIVNSNGSQLQGLPWDQTANTYLGESAIRVQVTGTALPTGNTAAGTVLGGVALSANLDASTVASAGVASPANYDWSTSMSVYDSQGGEHSLSLYLSKTAPNTWSVTGYMDGDNTTTVTSGTLTFNTDGTFNTGSPLAVSAVLTNGAATPFAFNIDLTNSTQFAASSGVNSISQDGRPAGKFVGLQISDTGLIEASYDNGQTTTLGQLNLYTFTNPNGLQPIGDNLWLNTVATGGATANNPGSGVAGTIQSGAMEESNVDLTAELVNLIVAQRTYQANAQTIRAQDQILQTLVNLR
jgi:flagellar hook protein FlgE